MNSTQPSQPSFSGTNEPREDENKSSAAESQSPFNSDNERVEKLEDDIKVDETVFSPNKTYYIQGHHMSSKQINIVDITGKVPVTFMDGKNVSDEFRDAAKEVGAAKDAVPSFIVKKKHWYNKNYNVYAGLDPDTSLADWKHPTFSTGTARIGFPPDSSHCTHNLSIAPLKWTRRTNEFVLNSVPFTWQCDDKFKSNRMTLSKKVGGVNAIVARYTQKWAAWGMGGVVLVDNTGVDDLVVVLTACTMLRRMEQRRWERHGTAGGGGSGASG